jgi:hypothetical protein
MEVGTTVALFCICTGAAPAVKTDVAKRARTKDAEMRNIIGGREKSMKEGKGGQL